MATVRIPGALVHLASGQETVSLEVRRAGDLLEALYTRFPDLRGHLDDAALAIDGEVHANPQYQRLQRDSEIDFVPRVGGG